MGVIGESAMSPDALLALAGSGQGGHYLRASFSESLVLLLVIAGLFAACVLIGALLSRRRRRQQQQPVANQWQALAVMGELCPHGWQADLRLYGWGAPVPADAPPARVPMVRLRWREFDEEPGRVAVERQVWAPTIEQALQAMVDDRRTDIAFEQIEQAAADPGGETWSE
jgi:hypothetical protein